ncbi:hypothetical protein L6164_016832 [Bauhinia variegata]|uniref:Uncharacterized protein n=1 Tax=Bauhinia variegata TaxID=167791 RepID=A0ACB9N6F3_BAUVA|nr:hypothetical protein L6164_016832 [Bauhinia variegata]
MASDKGGTSCIMQIAFLDSIYLVDTIQTIFHDCKQDSRELYSQFGIMLNNGKDIQNAYSLTEEFVFGITSEEETESSIVEILIGAAKMLEDVDCSSLNVDGSTSEEESFTVLAGWLQNNDGCLLGFSFEGMAIA